MKNATASGRRVSWPARVERLDHLEARQHAVVAVESAAGAHRVDVRTAQHGGERCIEAGALADHVADGVDADVETEVLHPRHDEVTAGAVVVGERQARATTVCDGSDLREIREAPHEAVDVDVHRFLHRSLQFVKEAVSIKGLRMIDRAWLG